MQCRKRFCWGRWAVTRDGDLAGDGLDDAVKAIGHPGRRAMLRLARDGERTATELADAAGLAPSAASPHLKLLKDVGLMHVRVDAKRRLYSVDFERLAQVRAVFVEPWADRLHSLKQLAETDAATQRRPGSA